MFRVNAATYRYVRLLVIYLALIPAGQVFASDNCDELFINDDDSEIDPLTDHQSYLRYFKKWTDVAYDLATLQRGQFALDKLLVDTVSTHSPTIDANSEFQRVLTLLRKKDQLLGVIVPLSIKWGKDTEKRQARDGFFNHIPYVHAVTLLQVTNATGIGIAENCRHALANLFAMATPLDHGRRESGSMSLIELREEVRKEIGVISDFRTVLHETVNLISDKFLQAKITVSILKNEHYGSDFESSADATYLRWSEHLPAVQLERLYLDLDRIALAQIAQRQRLLYDFKAK